MEYIIVTGFAGVRSIVRASDIEFISEIPAGGCNIYFRNDPTLGTKILENIETLMERLNHVD